ncbi:DEAD/DEAH box helicase [uncultured Methanobrevibacter sp.]|uniref:DEAD/DEAH box helicase n=1 Tax=uncultured Methanobrevibacter sp. TaxID=253161 RepID=UPI0026044981
MVTYIEHPLIREKSAEARLYQQILAADVLQNGNTMIVAPTALGKTIIAILVAAERLDKLKGSKVLILAPSKPLAIQHEENFRHFLNVTCTSITGAVKTDEREKRWNASQVICATPQTVESDLLNERYGLEDVSLVVFDECHHAVGSYSYVYLATRYVKEAKNHLILGLTASPGHDKEKIKEVCENLFIQDIKIKTEEDPDVKPYFNPIKIDWVRVQMDDELMKIRELANKALKLRLKGLKKMGIINTIGVSKRDILKARSRVQGKIAHSVNPPKECFQAISVLSAVINLQHAVELLETQGVEPFNDYIKRLRKKTTKAAKNILLDPNFSRAIYFAKEAEKNGLEHPKMKKLIELLKLELGMDGQTRLKSLRDDGENQESPKIIVFTQFRDTLDMIHKRCESEGIKSVRFFGQGTSDGKKGLTQKEQKQIIKSFKTGNYDVLISTSVAEEGIDIPAVDLVIMYEPVPSEVRMIQRRGRTGRKTSGRMKVLITEKTRDEGYYWTSIRRESKMKTQLATEEAIEELKLNAAERIEVEKNMIVHGKRGNLNDRDDSDSDLNDDFKEESFNEDLEEIELENENELKLKELNEKQKRINELASKRKEVSSKRISSNNDNSSSDLDNDSNLNEGSSLNNDSNLNGGSSLNNDSNLNDNSSSDLDSNSNLNAGSNIDSNIDLNAKSDLISNSNDLNSDSNSIEDSIEELSKNSNNNDEVFIYVDSREGNSRVIRALDTLGVKVKINAMAVADYQVSEEVAIERKTATDFVDSIMDKRLFKQARMMREEFKKPIMILEGDNFYSGFINPNAIRGSLASIAIDYGISIIPTRNPEDTAAMLKRIAIREQKGEKRSIQIRTERKPQNLWEQQLFIIESLPNIGPVHAKRLLEHFGSVKNVLEADEKKLQEVEGIGKKTAKNIREVIDSEYLYFKKELKDKKLI